MNRPTTDTDSSADTGSAARARAVQHLAGRWIRDALATGKPAEGGSFVSSPAGLWL
ncbi:serine protease, partial [Streptomyces fulvissimus]|nr:serine protease [Streptomyces microflavus]